MEQTQASFDQALEAFLGASSTSLADKNQLWRFLVMLPETAAVNNVLLEEEAAERLRLARRVEHELQMGMARPDYHLSSFDMSVICNLPLHTLHEALRSNFRALSYLTKSFVRIFLQSGSNDKTSVSDSNSTRRNATEVEKCLDRDNNRCLLLGTENPDVCHIFPFAANASKRNLLRLTDCYTVLTSLIGDNRSLVLGGIACSDKCWNMLALNHQMHKWWAEGYFALKCLGITPVAPGRSTVSIQFHWMPMHMRIAQRPRGSSKAAAQHRIWEEEVVLDQGQGETWLAEWANRPRCGGPGAVSPGSSHAHGVIAAADPCTGRPLQTGWVFTTGAMLTDEAGKMRVMLDIQWACLQIACMSSAVSSPDFLVDSDEDEDDGEPVGSPGPLSESGSVEVED